MKNRYTINFKQLACLTLLVIVAVVGCKNKKDKVADNQDPEIHNHNFIQGERHL